MPICLAMLNAADAIVLLDGSDSVWDEYADGRAKELFLTVFASPLQARLGLR